MAAVEDARFDAFRRQEVPLTHPLELAKTAVVCVVLLPLRLFFLLFWLLLYVVFVTIGTVGLRDYGAPLAPWRRWWLSEVMDVFRWAHKFRLTDMFLLTVGFPFLVLRGDDEMVDAETGEKANIIIANHSSYLDIFMLMHAFGQVPAFVAKKEVASVPLFGWFSKAWQCLFVDRLADRKNGVTAQLIERAANFDYPAVVVFPEGTTTNGRYMLPFRTGAFVAGAPVKPVVVRYPYKRFSVAWESCKFPTHIFRLITQVFNFCEITRMPVYVPNAAERADPALYARNVRQEMARVSGAALTDSTFQDKVAYLKLLRGEFNAQ